MRQGPTWGWIWDLRGPKIRISPSPNLAEEKVSWPGLLRTSQGQTVCYGFGLLPVQIMIWRFSRCFTASELFQSFHLSNTCWNNQRSSTRSNPLVRLGTARPLPILRFDSLVRSLIWLEHILPASSILAVHKTNEPSSCGICGSLASHLLMSHPRYWPL